MGSFRRALRVRKKSLLFSCLPQREGPVAPCFCGKLRKARRLLVGRESRPSPSLGEASSSIARGSRQAEHQEMCALVPTWGEVPVAGLGKVWGRKMVNWSFSNLVNLVHWPGLALPKAPNAGSGGCLKKWVCPATHWRSSSRFSVGACSGFGWDCSPGRMSTARGALLLDE